MLESIKKYVPLNWQLLGSPVNWIIVFLMVAIAGAGIALIVKSTDAPEDE